tara:strand:+ start:392 stop:640 length:249 start_codon:yes stop_codon:yes gene_type:complete
MNELEELMVVTMEECGELIQACSKAIRRDKYYDNKKILEEVGDVMCMLELMHEFDLFSWDDVDARVEVKREKLKKWSKLIEE